ncbi:MAG: thioredoxin family protein [Candidatus Hodarchaeales archaeon]
MASTDNKLEELKKSKIKNITGGDSKPNVPKGIVHLTDANIAQFLNKYSNVPIFIDYWAVWCRPCQMVAPTIEKLEKKYRGKMIFAKLNTDENPRTAQEMRIFSIPTFHVFHERKVIDTFVGAMPFATFDKRIEKVLGKINSNGSNKINPLYT